MREVAGPTRTMPSRSTSRASMGAPPWSWIVFASSMYCAGLGVSESSKTRAKWILAGLFPETFQPIEFRAIQVELAVGGIPGDGLGEELDLDQGALVGVNRTRKECDGKGERAEACSGQSGTP